MVELLIMSWYNECSNKGSASAHLPERAGEMDKYQLLRECVENFALLTQLGLSIAAPPVLCLYAASWLRRQCGLGLWIMVAALLLGLGGAVVNFWSTWKMIERREQRRGKEGQKRCSEKDGGEAL